MKQKRLKTIWFKMRDRCYNPKSNVYKYYGGRGISICNEWKNDFQTFEEWANMFGYTDDLSIDRVDVNGNYEPSNCQWATRNTQQANRRDSVKVMFNGELMNAGQISRLTGRCYGSVYASIRKGKFDTQQ